MNPLHSGANGRNVTIIDHESYKHWVNAVMGNSNSDRTEMLELLKDAIVEELTDKQREVIALVFVDGMTQTQAAQHLGVANSTVSRHMQAAKKKLKRAIKYSSKMLLKAAKHD